MLFHILCDLHELKCEILPTMLSSFQISVPPLLPLFQDRHDNWVRQRMRISRMTGACGLWWTCLSNITTMTANLLDETAAWIETYAFPVWTIQVTKQVLAVVSLVNQSRTCR